MFYSIKMLSRNIKLSSLAIILILVAPFCALGAQTQIFPPVNCSSSELKVISWKDGTASTYCISGQDVLKLALPNCSNGQTVAYNGSSFYCKDSQRLSCRVVQANATGSGLWSVPQCNSDEVVTGGGGAAEVPGSDICAGTNKGFLHTSIPQGNGWAVDAFQPGWTGDVCTRGYAVCCKIAD